MSLSIAEFFDRLRESGVLPLDDIAALESKIPERKRGQSAEKLVPKLIEAQKLTEHQAKALLNGKGHTLVLGDYLVLHKIGSGGMGQVFKARHRRMKRLVALKVLPPHVTEKQDAIKRFQREVEAAAKLTHPNIVAAFDAGEQKGIHYLVMEYVEGEDLDQVVRKYGPLPIATAHSYILQAALGLSHAHEQGVIHRDIKPANLLVDSQGVVKILDMGLARIEGLNQREESGEGLTQSGSMMGTIDYMSPEQALDTKTADERADIYSLGCTLFFVLTGRRMYEGETMMKRLMAHREHPIPSLAAERKDLPPGLAELFKQMVAKRPKERFRSMHELTTALLACKPAQVEVPAAVARSLAVTASGEHTAVPVRSPVMARSVEANRVECDPAEASAASVIPLADGESFSNLPPAPPVPPPFHTEETVAAESDQQTQVAPPPVLLPLPTAPIPQIPAVRGLSTNPVVTQRVSVVKPPDAGPRNQFPVTMVVVLASGVVVLAALLFLGWHLLNRPTHEEDLDALLAESRKAVAKTPKTKPVPAKSGTTTPGGIVPATPVGKAPVLGDSVVNSLGMKLAYIPAGGFDMGSPPDELGRSDEEFQHAVDITRPFYLGIYEVTQKQYETLMGSNPSFFSAKGEGSARVSGLDTTWFPVENISWEEANEFCRRLSAKEGKLYRLPREAEWEYCCRAGTLSPFHFGSELNGAQANCDGNFPYGTETKGAFLNRPAQVGSYGANLFGLFDMHGNVREWCSDWHGEAYYRDSPFEDPTGPGFGVTRVLRGGSWSYFADVCRSAHRHHLAPDQRAYDHGFRVLREP